MRLSLQTRQIWSRMSVAGMLALLLCLGVVLGTAAASNGATFVVDSTSDAVDATPGDGTCATAGGECTLRAAIMEANALAGADTVVLSTATYTLTVGGAGEDGSITGDLDISDDLTLSGAGRGSTVLDGGALDRVFDIVTSTVSVTIEQVTIQNGVAGCSSTYREGGGVRNTGTLLLADSEIVSNTAAGCTGSGESRGGGIYNDGQLVISGCIVSHNTSDNLQGWPAGHAGGIYSYGLAAYLSLVDTSVQSNTGEGIYNLGGVVAISGTTVSGNDHGGLASLNGSTWITASTVAYNTGRPGITNYGPLTVTHSAIISNTSLGDGGGVGVPCCDPFFVSLANTTISGNSAGGSFGDGGGIYFDSAGTLSLSNVTIVNNSASGLGMGGGVYNSYDYVTVTLKNSIIAGNTAAQAPDCYRVTDSQGYNIVGDATDCAFVAATGDQVGTSGSPIDPHLGPLQDNGGNTVTHALLAGSPALDQANPGGCTDGLGAALSTDQRWRVRPTDGDLNGTPVCDIGAYELQPWSHWVYLPLILR
jgi:CSLREA domain-containing protein